MDRVFHHFTTLACAAQIIDEGIRLGRMIQVVEQGYVQMNGYQWLTTDNDYDQAWAAQSPQLRGRTEVRLSVVVPALEFNNLKHWVDICGDDDLAAALKEQGGCDSWWLFKGVIPPEWIKAVLSHEDFAKGEPGWSELCACGAIPTQKMMNGKALDMAEDVCDACYSEKFKAKMLRTGGLH